MSVADPIADMLTRIRNAIVVKHKTVTIPGSKLAHEMLKCMVAEGYLADVTFEKDNKQGVLTAVMKYDDNEVCAIDGLRRISKQGRRIYLKSNEIPVERSGYGTIIVTTSQGVLTDSQARKAGVGGELLCAVW